MSFSSYKNSVVQLFLKLTTNYSFLNILRHNTWLFATCHLKYIGTMYGIYFILAWVVSFWMVMRNGGFFSYIFQTMRIQILILLRNIYTRHDIKERMACKTIALFSFFIFFFPVENPLKCYLNVITIARSKRLEWF